MALGFLQQVSSHHLTIWKFVYALKRGQDVQEIHIAKGRTGCYNIKSAMKYRDVNCFKIIHIFPTLVFVFSHLF